MSDFLRLYPQYSTRPDRRQKSVPVPFERRSGTDRRSESRITVDPKLRKDIEDTFKSFNINPDKKDKPNIETELVAGGLSTVPYFRRFTGIVDAIKSHDYIKAGGKAFIQLANIKMDKTDIESAIDQVKNKRFKLDEAQKPFGFIQGTLLDDIPIFQKLADYDITLYEAKISRRLLKKLGAEEPEYIDDALKLNGSLISRIVGRSLLRIPKFSLIFLSLLELPSIIKANNKVKQTGKSAINIISTISFGALLGAIGAYAGPIGSLIGLGLGTWLGNKAAKKINSTF